MRDEMKRTEQEATDLRGRGWSDRYEGPNAEEKRRLRRKARRKLRRERPSSGAGEEGT